VRNALESRNNRFASISVDRKKSISDGVSASFGYRETSYGREELVGNLCHDSCAVTGSGVRTNGTTVLEVAESVKSDINDVVPRGTTHGRYQSEPARVLVKGRIKKPRSFGHSGETVVWRKKIHDTSPKK
jgi:hypothetical protein